jgi:sugar phosphate permease
VLRDRSIPAADSTVYYGWRVLLVAAAAMVGTLPGRSQGLGLITEPLLTDLQLDRVTFAELNFWATIVGAAGAIGMGHAIDRLGSRTVLTLVALGLGAIVCGMSQTSTAGGLAVWLTLTRAVGQSALSVVSLAMVGHWFVRRIDTAMAVYSIVMSIGFMVAFPAVGALIQRAGWRTAWLGVGCALMVVLAPAAWIVVRRSPEACGLRPDGDRQRDPMLEGGGPAPPPSPLDGHSWRAAIATPAFWVFAAGTALYGLVASGIGLFNESILAERGFGAGVYYQSLVVTALTALAGNFVGGWLARHVSLTLLLAASLADGARRGARHGALLQRLGPGLRTPRSRPNPGRGAGAHGPRLCTGSTAPRVVHRVDRQLRTDVPPAGRRGHVCGRGGTSRRPAHASVGARRRTV